MYPVLIAFVFVGTLNGEDQSPSGNEAPTRAVPDSSAPASKVEASSGFTASPKITRYARYLIEKYDRNRDGRLQSAEWKGLHGQPALIDRDADEEISVSELVEWVRDYGRRKRIGIPSVAVDPSVAASETGSPSNTPSESESQSSAGEGSAVTATERRRDSKFFVPAKRLPQGLPDWFLSRDLDGDGQLTASEFSPTNLAAELADFSNYDANKDGVLTAQECVRDPSGKTTRKPRPKQ